MFLDLLLCGLAKIGFERKDPIKGTETSATL